MANTVLLEARPFRPFKSSEEYLYAMKEDLAEWFHTLYPELGINVDNFMDRIDTGVALCKHANNVKLAAIEYVARRQARALTRSMTCSTISATATSSNVVANTPDVRYLALAKPSTFFARDNVSNFIDWCRNSLRIFECLLFETDDLILRKNEKHVILCLLEVARKGAKFGMLAPMLVQMERQIDREIAQEQRAGGGDTICDSDSESEEMEPPVIMVYGPQPQIVTNDLKSLDEMVRDLVERCTCPTQFPMIRVSEGKYRIGDTKVLIFVRILRSHVMVRVGGGWDTLSHYLDKHDPCRCRSQHRSALTSRLVNRPGAADLSGAQVYYERRSSVSSVCSNTGGQTQPVNHLLTPTLSSRNRSRSPTPSRKLSSQLLANESRTRRSASPNPLRKSPNTQRKSLNVPGTNRLRSRSPTPSLFASDKHVASIKIQPDHPTHISETSLQILDNGTTTTTGENGSDNGSEISDEGYRSLGLIQNSSAETTKICNKINRLSLNSQNSLEDADFGERSSQNNSDSGSNNGDTKTIEEDTSITTVDGPNSDIYNETGLRKTYFSDTYYNDKKPDTNVISKPRARSMEHNTSRSRSNSKEKTECGSSPIKRQSMAYRSVRERKPPVQNTSPIKSSMSPSRSNIAVMSKKSPNLNMREMQSGNNTWSGRQSKQRPSLATDTFTPPPKAMTPPMNFSRNSAGRTSLSTNRGGVMYDNNGRRIIKNTSSANTSPTKQKSPLLEQIMKSAEESQNDAQMFEKIKDVLKQYSSLVNCDEQGLDFTSAWVQSQGCNETKRCSVVSDGVVSSSSGESSSTRNGSGMSYVSPRKDSKAVGQVSKIPAPVSYKRSTTDLY